MEILGKGNIRNLVACGVRHVLQIFASLRHRFSSNIVSSVLFCCSVIYTGLRTHTSILGSRFTTMLGVRNSAQAFMKLDIT
jgi:hypothetical protein